MTESSVKKLSYIANTALLAFVIMMMAYFASLDAIYLIYLSIGAISVYLIGYVLIAKNYLNSYVKLLYLWIVFYMGVTTICLGIEPGFHLYSMSLIPIIFCTEYIGYKLNTQSHNAVKISIDIAIIDVISCAIAAWHGPIYPINSANRAVLLVINSVSVFCFLIFYTSFLLKSIVKSEKALERIAHVDKLTGLYNRHYMIALLSAIAPENKKWIAMVDIDNFKQINDTYGHDAGDYVLQKLGDLMKAFCKGSTVSRWGGEEFLILSESDEKAVAELLRREVAKKPLSFDGKEIKVTVSMGVTEYNPDETLEEWIKSSDEKLYQAKNTGKNKVVF